MRRYLLRGGIGTLLLVAALTAAPARVLASCQPLDFATVPRSPETAVFAGTVTGLQADHVFMRIEAWFVGANPVDAAEIVGGRGSSEPGVITSVDWTPAVGEQYVVVAERQAPNGFVTKPCQQVRAVPEVVDRATAILGSPQPPPFDTPAPAAVTPSPEGTAIPAHDVDGSGSPASGAAGSLLWAAIAAITGLLAFGTYRQWRRRRRSG